MLRNIVQDKNVQTILNTDKKSQAKPQIPNGSISSPSHDTAIETLIAAVAEKQTEIVNLRNQVINLENTKQELLENFQELARSHYALEEQLTHFFDYQLIEAVRDNNVDKIQQILPFHPDISFHPTTGPGALELAFQSGQEEIIDCLVPEFNLNALKAAAKYASQLAFARTIDRAPKNPELLCELYQYTENQEFRKIIANNLLLMAAKHGNPGLADTALTYGADINATDKNGQTALHIASFYGEKEIIEFLLQRGASIDIQDFDNRTSEEINSAQVIKNIYQKYKARQDDMSQHNEGSTLSNTFFSTSLRDAAYKMLAQLNQNGRHELAKTLSQALKNSDIETVQLMLRDDQPNDQLQSDNNNTPSHR